MEISGCIYGSVNVNMLQNNKKCQCSGNLSSLRTSVTHAVRENELFCFSTQAFREEIVFHATGEQSFQPKCHAVIYSNNCNTISPISQ